MSNKKIRYRERVPSPRLVRIGTALFVSIFFWWMLVESVYSTSGRMAAVYPSLVFILGLAVFEPKNGQFCFPPDSLKNCNLY